MKAQILIGDSLERLKTMDSASVQCVVTSPPYWGLRDYGVVGQLGLERTPDEYISRIAEVFREVRRVLRKDGTLWLNIGDSYAAGGKGGGGSYMAERKDAAWQSQGKATGWKSAPQGMKSKDLVGIPWMLAFALRADGWYLRQDIIWAKPNPMPESVTDRCTKSHEYLFLLSKSERYYYDQEAILEDVSAGTHARLAQDVEAQIGSERENGGQKTNGNMSPAGSGTKNNESFDAAMAIMPDKRNKRSVWTIPTQGYAEAHFATFPEALVEPCILAGSREGDTVLDPFCGSGTTGAVALRYARNFIGIEINPAYASLAEKRIDGEAPLLHETHLHEEEEATA